MRKYPNTDLTMKSKHYYHWYCINTHLRDLDLHGEFVDLCYIWASNDVMFVTVYATQWRPYRTLQFLNHKWENIHRCYYQIRSLLLLVLKEHYTAHSRFLAVIFPLITHERQVLRSTIFYCVQYRVLVYRDISRVYSNTTDNGKTIRSSYG